MLVIEEIYYRIVKMVSHLYDQFVELGRSGSIIIPSITIFNRTFGPWYFSILDIIGVSLISLLIFFLVKMVFKFFIS